MPHPTAPPTAPSAVPFNASSTVLFAASCLAGAAASPLASANADVDSTPPDVAIVSPAADGQTFGPEPVLGGTASDVGGSGFERVRVVVRDNEADPPLWLDFSSGRFEPQSGNLPDHKAKLFSTSDSFTSWSVVIPLTAPGDYQLFAIAYDNAGNVRTDPNGEKAWSERRFLIGEEGAISTEASR